MLLDNLVNSQSAGIKILIDYGRKEVMVKTGNELKIAKKGFNKSESIPFLAESSMVSKIWIMQNQNPELFYCKQTICY